MKQATLLEFHYENVKAFQEDLIIDHDYDEVWEVTREIGKAFRDEDYRSTVINENVWVIENEEGKVLVYQINGSTCARNIIAEVE